MSWLLVQTDAALLLSASVRAEGKDEKVRWVLLELLVCPGEGSFVARNSAAHQTVSPPGWSSQEDHRSNNGHRVSVPEGSL